MKYHFEIIPGGSGFTAFCVELENCITGADTMEELEISMKEVLNIYLEVVDKPIVAPYCLEESVNIAAIEVDPKLLPKLQIIGAPNETK